MAYDRLLRRIAGALLAKAIGRGAAAQGSAAPSRQPALSAGCYAPMQRLTAPLRRSFVEELRPIAARAERDHGLPAPCLAGADPGYRSLGLAPGHTGQCKPGRENGGAEVGPNPTDRGRPGTKRHLVTDARGTPLGVVLSGANRNDSFLLARTLNAVPGVGIGRRGRPRRRLAKLHADRGYGHVAAARSAAPGAVTPRLVRRGVESSRRLGKHRWVVERTLAWLDRFRRLTIRDERRAAIHLAFTLACALICLNRIRWLC